MPERKDVLDPVLLGATALGGRLFRNNSGMAFHKDGSVVRYGLANPGGSDLIGWMPHVVSEFDIGRTLARFVAVEGKWGTTRVSPAQMAFLAVVEAAGGIALVGKDPKEILASLEALTK
jgi:hypothetical protein